MGLHFEELDCRHSDPPARKMSLFRNRGVVKVDSGWMVRRGQGAGLQSMYHHYYVRSELGGCGSYEISKPNRATHFRNSSPSGLCSSSRARLDQFIKLTLQFDIKPGPVTNASNPNEIILTSLSHLPFNTSKHPPLRQKRECAGLGFFTASDMTKLPRSNEHEQKEVT